MLSLLRTYLICFLMSQLALPAAMASIVTKPVTFSAGQTLPAASLNSDFDTLYADYNGNVTNANLASGASIALSKLSPTSILFILMATGNNTLASGITGDTVPRVTFTSDGGLKFGPGTSTALDLLLKRSSSTTFAFRNAADSADANITAGSATLSTPLATTNGGTGLATVGGSGTVLTSNGTTLSYQAAGAGTVTSVAGAVAGGTPFSFSGTPITSTGTLTLNPAITGKGYIISGSGANTMTTLAPGSDGQVLSALASAGSGLSWITASGTGTVTSAGFTGDGVLFNSSVTGSPITTTGTFVPSLVSQTGNKVLASPSGGGSGAWAARTLVAADLPIITAAKGGTGVANTPTQGSVLGGTISGTYTDVTPATQTGQALVYNSSLGGNDLQFGAVGLRGGGAGVDLVPSAAKGNLLVGNSTNTSYSVQAVGADGTVLTADSSLATGIKWANVSGTGTVTSVGQSLTGLPFMSITGSPVTTSGTLALAGSGATGDLPYFSAANTMSKLTAGSNGNVLTLAAGVPSWAAPTGGFTNPMTTTGDIISSSPGSTPVRLGIGSTGNVLTVAGGVPTWAAPVTGSGTVNSGTAGQMTYYAGTGTTVSGNANATVSSGALTLGQSGTAGSVVLNGATSGTCTVKVPAVAGTSTNFQLPATNGSNTNVLQTDGSGNTSWVAASAGGMTETLAPLTSSPIRKYKAWSTQTNGATAFLGVGTTVPVATGTASQVVDSDSVWYNELSAATTNSIAGWKESNTSLRFDHFPRFMARVKTDPSSLATQRYWIGITSAALDTIATPTTQNVAAFGYDTGIDGSVHWYAVTCNGASGVTRTDTGVTVSTATPYDLAIDASSGSSVLFYVNGTLTNTISTTLPTSTSTASVQAVLTTLANAGINLKMCSAQWSQK